MTSVFGADTVDGVCDRILGRGASSPLSLREPPTTYAPSSSSLAPFVGARLSTTRPEGLLQETTDILARLRGVSETVHASSSAVIRDDVGPLHIDGETFADDEAAANEAARDEVLSGLRRAGEVLSHSHFKPPLSASHHDVYAKEGSARAASLGGSVVSRLAISSAMSTQLTNRGGGGGGSSRGFTYTLEEARHALLYSSSNAAVAHLMERAAEERRVEALAAAKAMPPPPAPKQLPQQPEAQPQSAGGATPPAAGVASSVPSPYPSGDGVRGPITEEPLRSELQALRRQQEALLKHQREAIEGIKAVSSSQSAAAASALPPAAIFASQEEQLKRCLEALKAEREGGKAAQQRLALVAAAVAEANSGLRVERQRMEEERRVWRRERSLIAHEAAQLKRLRQEQAQAAALVAEGRAARAAMEVLGKVEVSTTSPKEEKTTSRSIYAASDTTAPPATAAVAAEQGKGSIGAAGGVVRRAMIARARPSAANRAGLGPHAHHPTMAYPQPFPIAIDGGGEGTATATENEATVEVIDSQTPLGQRQRRVSTASVAVGGSTPLTSLSSPPRPLFSSAFAGTQTSPLPSSAAELPPAPLPPLLTSDASNPSWEPLTASVSRHFGASAAGGGAEGRETVVGRAAPSIAPLTLVTAPKQGSAAARLAAARDDSGQHPSIPLTPAEEAALVSAGLRRAVRVAAGGTSPNDGDAGADEDIGSDGEEAAIFGGTASSSSAYGSGFDDVLREARARKRRIRALYGAVGPDEEDASDPIVVAGVRHLLHELIAADIKAGVGAEAGGHSSGAEPFTAAMVEDCLLELCNVPETAHLVNGDKGDEGTAGRATSEAEHVPAASGLYYARQPATSAPNAQPHSTAANNAAPSPASADEAETVMAMLRDIVGALAAEREREGAVAAAVTSVAAGPSPNGLRAANGADDEARVLREVIAAPLRDRSQRDLLEGNDILGGEEEGDDDAEVILRGGDRAVSTITSKRGAGATHRNGQGNGLTVRVVLDPIVVQHSAPPPPADASSYYPTAVPPPGPPLVLVAAETQTSVCEHSKEQESAAADAVDMSVVVEVEGADTAALASKAESKEEETPLASQTSALPPPAPAADSNANPQNDIKAASADAKELSHSARHSEAEGDLAAAEEVPRDGDAADSEKRGEGEGPAAHTKAAMLHESAMVARSSGARELLPMVRSEGTRSAAVARDAEEKIALSSAASSDRSRSSSSSSSSASSRGGDARQRGRRGRDRSSRKRQDSPYGREGRRRGNSSSSDEGRRRRRRNEDRRRDRSRGRRRSRSRRRAASDDERRPQTLLRPPIPSAAQREALFAVERAESEGREAVEALEYSALAGVFERYVPRHAVATIGASARPPPPVPNYTGHTQTFMYAHAVQSNMYAAPPSQAPPLGAPAYVAPQTYAPPMGAANMSGIGRWADGVVDAAAVDRSMPPAEAQPNAPTASIAAPALNQSLYARLAAKRGIGAPSADSSAISSTNASSYGPNGLHAFFVPEGLRGHPIGVGYARARTSSARGSSQTQTTNTSGTTATSLGSSEWRHRLAQHMAAGGAGWEGASE